MIVNKLILANFRSYEIETFTFNKGLNIIIGQNAQGKTNIIESIYILGLIKSFLTNNDNDLIRFNNDFCQIKGEVELNNRLKNLQVIIGNNSKKLKINNTLIKKNSDYISKLNIIIFSARCLELINGQPIVKRKFLNIEISQLNKKYFIILAEFNKVLKIRNEYLKNNRDKIDEVYFEIITTKLVELSLSLVKYRCEFIDKINERISKIFNDIALSNDNLKIEYIYSYDYHDDIITTVKEYQKNRIKEIKYQTTLFGPHRDSFKILLNNRDMSLYCSQGQQRMAIIALKLSEIEIFKKETKENPIILLDDVFSELDEFKQNQLLNLLNLNSQVIMTTTDINNIGSNLIKKAKVIKIKESKIIEVINRGRKSTL